MIPELEKLRRFSLAVGLILISYVIAGIELEAGAKVSVLGLPFTIQRPELLPLSLALASFYGLVRFYYYGFMLAQSPHRHRKDLLHKLHGKGTHGTYMGSAFMGPAEYSTTPEISDRAAVEAQLNELINAFPKVLNFKPSGKVESNRGIEGNGETYVVYSAEVTIPFLCRIAAAMQDLDYFAPIGVNIVVLVLVAGQI
jgi:hypothetical protein